MTNDKKNSRFKRNCISENINDIITIAKTYKINITEKNIKFYNNDDGLCLNIQQNGKSYIIYVDEDGSIHRKDKNKVGRKREKMHYHNDKCGEKKVYSWAIAFHQVKTTHNPKSMNNNEKYSNIVDKLLGKNKYIKLK